MFSGPSLHQCTKNLMIFLIFSKKWNTLLAHSYPIGFSIVSILLFHANEIEHKYTWMKIENKILFCVIFDKTSLDEIHVWILVVEYK